jgi:hypothetical protein
VHHPVKLFSFPWVGVKIIPFIPIHFMMTICCLKCILDGREIADS